MYEERERPGSDIIFSRHNWFPLCRRPFFCFCRYLYLQDSFESLHSTFSCSSITSRKHGSQYATQLPAFQPLTVSSFSKTKQDIQKYFLHRKQVFLCVLKAKGARLNFFTHHFPQFSVFAWQLRENELYCAPYESPAATEARSGQNHYNKIASQVNFNPTAQQILWTCCVLLSSLNNTFFSVLIIIFSNMNYFCYNYTNNFLIHTSNYFFIGPRIIFRGIANFFFRAYSALQALQLKGTGSNV